jgi:hypothetical protein
MKFFIVFIIILSLDLSAFPELHQSQDNGEINVTDYGISIDNGKLIATGYGFVQDDTTLITKEKDAELAAIGSALEEALTHKIGFLITSNDKVLRSVAKGTLNGFFIDSIIEIDNVNFITLLHEVRIITPSKIQYNIKDFILQSISSRDYDKVISDLKDAKINIQEVSNFDEGCRKVVLSLSLDSLMDESTRQEKESNIKEE